MVQLLWTEITAEAAGSNTTAMFKKITWL
jgi:hypothetical protein